MRWFLYIVKCKDGSLYTGITTNLVRRVREHNSGIGAKFLRGKLPVVMVYNEMHNSQSEARKREEAIKKWKREHKIKLIEKGLSQTGYPSKGLP
ncbi:GIY-YIG nuclease family protein [Candidatus Microgenomates bacterium]|nr:GIY-YIG nuclease family protein [Candidatus Microgenomates bacterium]